MWKDIKLKYDGCIRKLAGEFEVSMPAVLPYAKMKVRVYEEDNGRFTGRTDVLLIRKTDGSPEGAVGFGATVDEALEDTINCFIGMLEEDYKGVPHLGYNDIGYAEVSDF